MTYSTAEHFIQPTLVGVKSTGWGPFKENWYRLVEEYIFEWGKKNGRKRLFMAPGFEYNKASVPLIFAVIGFTTDGEADAASMFHDRFFRDHFQFLDLKSFRYEVQLPNGDWVTDSSSWKKNEANDLYEYMCELGKMSKPQAETEEFAIKYLWPPNWFK